MSILEITVAGCVLLISILKKALSGWSLKKVFGKKTTAMITWYTTAIILAGSIVMASTAEDCKHCYPGSSCWPKMQDFLDFNNSIDGFVEFSNDARYQTDSVMYNVRVTRFPYLIVFVANVDDVIRCVKFANKFNIKITIRSSGHDYIGRATADGSIQINLREMKGLRFNLNSKRWSDGEVTAETGNTWIRLYNESSKYGRAIVGGSAHTVSMGGYTLGGGHAPIGRKFGAAVDNLLEVEMVTANGSVVYANASSTTVIDTETGTSTTTKDTDLFWALRGGGGSTFGIVTAFTYRLHMDSKMQYLKCFIPLYDVLYQPIATDFMRRLYYLLGTTLAPEWGGYHIFSSASPPGVYDSRGALYILMNHYGEYGSPSFNTILPLKNDIDQHCTWENKTGFLDYTSMGTDPIYYRSYIFNTLMQPDSFTDAFYADLFKILYSRSQMPNGGCTGTLIGGHMKDVNPDDTALSPNFRTAVMSLTCGISWRESEEDAHVEYGEKLTDILLKHGKGTYFNEPSAHLPDWKERYWGGHYDRLLGIKQQWDPTNVFTCLHCVGSDLNETNTQRFVPNFIG